MLRPLLCLVVCSNALALRGARVRLAPHARATRPAMNIFNDIFGGKDPKQQVAAEPAAKPKDEWTEEDRKRNDFIANNWSEYKKDNQKDYVFFNGPSPKTGVQENMPSFFDQNALDGVEVPPQLVLFGGVAAVLLLLFASFIITG